jgi:hypothetical protein
LLLPPVGDVETHHDVARCQWGLGPGGEAPVVVGSAVVTIDDGGQICSAIGFVDVAPEQMWHESR